MRREATDIVSVDFAVEEGTPANAAPGAHLRLVLGDRLVRKYSPWTDLAAVPGYRGAAL